MAQDGKSTLINLCSHVLIQALFVIHICVGTKAVQLFSRVFKQWLVADHARVIAVFAFFVGVVLFVDSLHCLKFNSLFVELYLSSLVCFFVSLLSFFTNPLGQSFVILFGVIFEVGILS